jgi:hypothetical protein
MQTATRQVVAWSHATMQVHLQVIALHESHTNSSWVKEEIASGKPSPKMPSNDEEMLSRIDKR